MAGLVDRSRRQGTLSFRSLVEALHHHQQPGRRGRQGMQGMSKTDQEYAGDFGTPEQQIPPSGLPGVDWESCMTMNTTWGFKFYDDKWKSPEVIIRNLIDIASKGGNYLLNVGPTKEGLIPEPTRSEEHTSELPSH